MVNIELKANKIGSHRYVQYVVGLYMARWGIVYALGVVVGLSLSIINANFLYLTFMLICLGFTFVLYFVYARYGLVEESRYSVLEKSVTVDDDGFNLHFTNNDDEEPKAAVLVKWEEIKELKPRHDALLIVLKAKNYLFIALPYDAFKSKEDLKRLVLFSREKISFLA